MAKEYPNLGITEDRSSNTERFLNGLRDFGKRVRDYWTWGAIKERVASASKEGWGRLPGELGAMWREAVKDVRGTVHETFFGKPEHMAEPGAPLNPTSQMVTRDLGETGYDAMNAYAPKELGAPNHQSRLDAYVAETKPPEQGTEMEM